MLLKSQINLNNTFLGILKWLLFADLPFKAFQTSTTCFRNYIGISHNMHLLHVWDCYITIFMMKSKNIFDDFILFLFMSC